MADDANDAAGPPRSKRPPPTIDLAATEVSTAMATEANSNASDKQPPDSASAETTHVENEPTDTAEPPTGRKQRLLPVSAIAALSGAATGALVVTAFWLLALPSQPPPAIPTAPQITASAFGALTARVAAIENKPAPPAAAADPRAAARLDAQDKVIASLREELGVLRAQGQQLTAATEALKTAPREAAPAAPAPAAVDLSPINDRLGQIEQTAKKLSAETAQRNAQPVNDPALRRIVAASLLDASVRQGESYAALLDAAKLLAADPAVLKPLDAFAATGVPSANVLSRELVAQISKLAPKATAATTGEASILDRLQTGAAKLVRIQRTDAAAGNDRDAIVSRATAAALRNDVATTRRELDALTSADRAAMQPWIDKADARSAALAASRQFAADAMAALAKPAQ